MNVYELSREFWNWSFDNPDKVKPIHSALYFFAIEHCNRLGWKEKFGFPTTMAMEAIGIKSYNTFISALKDLVEFGFIIMVEKSKNQYSANIIALSNFNKALDEASDKALDKALIKHGTKQSESTVQSIDSINKQIYNITNIQYYNDEEAEKEKAKSILKSKQISLERWCINSGLDKDQVFQKIDEFVDKKTDWQENDWKSEGDLVKNFEFWLPKNAKVIVNDYKCWTKKQFFEKIEELKKAVNNKTICQEFFNHYSMPAENGKMRFQNMDAWDTREMLKKWINNQKNTV